MVCCKTRCSRSFASSRTERSGCKGEGEGEHEDEDAAEEEEEAGVVAEGEKASIHA